MKNDINFAELALTDLPLVDTFVYPEGLGSYQGSPSFSYVSCDYISDVLKDQLARVNLKIFAAVLFKKSPGIKNALHKDLALINKKWNVWHCAVNWNLFNSESRMSWYSISQKEIWPKVIDTSEPYFLSGIHYGFPGNRITNVKSVTLIESTSLLKPALVRTDVPHQIENLDNTDRWSLSIRFTENYKWEQLLKILNPYIL
jgi:hypothetical protein